MKRILILTVLALALIPAVAEAQCVKQGRAVTVRQAGHPDWWSMTSSGVATRLPNFHAYRVVRAFSPLGGTSQQYRCGSKLAWYAGQVLLADYSGGVWRGYATATIEAWR